RRGLANAALDLLAMSGDQGAVERIVDRFRDADNMTDRLSALAILTQAALPERQAALDAFYDRYRGDALVLDKWFALQATVPAPETLDRVKSLQQHSAFSPTNPN